MLLPALLLCFHVVVSAVAVFPCCCCCCVSMLLPVLLLCFHVVASAVAVFPCCQCCCCVSILLPVLLLLYSHCCILTLLLSSLFFLPHFSTSLREQVVCAWDLYEHVLIQKVSIKLPFTQRLPDFGSCPLFLLPTEQSLVVICNEYIAELNLGLDVGDQTEGDLFTSHKHPLCSALFNKHFNQVTIIRCLQDS